MEIPPDIDPSRTVGVVFRAAFGRGKMALEAAAEQQGVDLDEEKLLVQIPGSELQLTRRIANEIDGRVRRRSLRMPYEGAYRGLLRLSWEANTTTGTLFTPSSITAFVPFDGYSIGFGMHSEVIAGQEGVAVATRDRFSGNSPEAERIRQRIPSYGSVLLPRHVEVGSLSDNEQLLLNIVDKTIRLVSAAASMCISGDECKSTIESMCSMQEDAFRRLTVSP